jgi:predicted transcriptional regulator
LVTDATLGERELDVMAVLWEIGSGTVAEVREHLDVPLAYTTVLTILRNLEPRSCVARKGRGHPYWTAATARGLAPGGAAV